MKRVANRKVISKLSWRTMREKREKNLIAILAIALTALLFTAVFTVGSTLVRNQRSRRIQDTDTGRI